MSDSLFDKIGKGITSTATAIAAPTNDHTVPRKAKWFGYPLLALMAWRTARILFRAVPQDIFGYIFAGVGLFATEIGALYWFGLLTKHAHEEKDNDQKAIAAVMFVGDFLLSIVTTIADITDTTGTTKITQTDWAMPVALIGSGIWAIANVGAWLWYQHASPVAKANRKAQARQFAFELKQRQAVADLEEKKLETASEIAHLAEEVRLREEYIAAKERVLGRTEAVEKRAKDLAQRVETWKRDDLHTPGADIPKEELFAVPVTERTNGNGTAPKT